MALLSHSSRRQLRLVAAGLLAFATQLVGFGAFAQEAPRRALHAAGLQLTASNFDAGGAAGYRIRFPGGTQLGLEGRALAVRDAYLDGFAAKGGFAGSGSGLLMLPVVQSGPLDLHFRTSLGLRALRVDETTGLDRSSVTLLADLGPVVNVRVDPRVTLRTGFLVVSNFQLSPAFASEALGQVLLAGAAWGVTRHLQLHADLETGGLFGFDGDGGKYLVRGTLGARWVFGNSATTWLSF